MHGNRIQVFFDGECPLCRREISFLSHRNKKGLIRFTDISDPDFDASAYGRSVDDFMGQIHGRLPSGEFIVGVEVFRNLHSAVGFKWLVRISRAPGISWLLDRSYDYFSRNRLRLTGRCERGVCEVPAANSNRPRKRAA